MTASGDPNGAKIGITQPAVVRIKVTNTGTAPEAYFVDGRTDTKVRYNLPSVTSSQATMPLTVAGNIPFYLVPSQTTGLLATATTHGATPIQFDVGAPTGDPDIASGQGTAVTARVSAGR